MEKYEWRGVPAVEPGPRMSTTSKEFETSILHDCKRHRRMPLSL